MKKTPISESDLISIEVTRSYRLFPALVVLIWAGIVLVSPVGAGEWRQAVSPRSWSFPRDHGSHPEYSTEWWYFTGILQGQDGALYGYELTFFRRGICVVPSDPNNAWSVRDIYLAHFAVTDVGNDEFRFLERISRAGPGLAGASQERMDVWLFDWTAEMEDTCIRLRAKKGGMAIELELLSDTGPILHGSNGLSRKGPAQGQASYYYSLVDLRTSGFVQIPWGGRVPVQGESWFDHEFGSNALSSAQQGWDWFSLHLSDGRKIMIYLLRNKDGSVDPASSGTLVEKGGSYGHLSLPEIRVEALDYWKSSGSEAIYPNRWRIRIPSASVDLLVSTPVPDQELITGHSAGIIYWEGLVLGEGSSGGRPVTVKGYAELTGYAGSLGGRM